MMRELLLLLKELEDICSVCNRCGMCQAVCPVFLVTGHEADVARGKLALLDGLLEEILTNPENVLQRLNRCLLCGSCESNCSRKVEILEIFVKTRVIITRYRGLSLIKKAVLRKILAHPMLFDKAVRIASKWQFLLTKPVGDGHNTSMVRRFFPFLRGRNIPRIPGKSFHTISDEKKNVSPKTPDTSAPNVVFFAGCLIDKVLPEVGLACVDVLEHFGVKVTLQKHEGCCGIPAAASGDVDAFHKMVEYNLKQLEDLKYDFLITACATCTFTMKKLWPLIYGKTHKKAFEDVEVISSKIMDISEFLVKKTDAGNADVSDAAKTPVSLTWHDPCHLKKTSGVFQAPRTLLKSLPGYELTEMEGADLCCGGGGSFSLEHYGLSKKIGEVKTRNIRSTGAQIVATGCPGCMIQLRDMLEKSQVSADVKHVMELVAESLHR